MNDLRNVDLSHIPDENLTPEQKKELQHRFDKLFRGNAGTKKRAQGPAKPKKVRKWVPGQK